MAKSSHNRKTIYLSDKTLEELGNHESVSARVSVMLDRYRELVRRIDPFETFSEQERNAILDATVSWWPEPAATIPLGVALEVQDSLADGLAEKWRVDGPALVAKLRSLGIGEQFAMVEWIEQWKLKSHVR